MIEEEGMDAARWARAYMVACGMMSEAVAQAEGMP
jgi:hypothetical protein